MAVIVTAEIPGGSQQEDETLMQEVGLAAGPPQGFIFRAGGPIPGGWKVVSGWQSREDFEHFYRDKIQPATQKIGRGPAAITVWEIASIRTAPTGG
jgi:hypothetical protein